ncbi:MAG: CBS domain-containing protein [Candidatus Micrarchaeia archaeon]
MNVSEIMQKEYLSFRADQTIDEVIRAFAKHKVTSAPVFTGTKFIGMISDAEIAKFLIDEANASIRDAKKPLGEKKTPIHKVKNATAGGLCKMPRTILSPDKSIIYALPEVARKIDCIPVLEGEKFQGVVREGDIIKLFFHELVRQDAVKASKSPQATPQKEQHTAVASQLGSKIGTDMDLILEILKRDGETSCTKMAAELGVSEQAVERLCESLANHNLVQMKYSFMAGTTVRGTTSEKN